MADSGQQLALLGSSSNVSLVAGGGAAACARSEVALHAAGARRGRGDAKQQTHDAEVAAVWLCIKVVVMAGRRFRTRRFSVRHAAKETSLTAM